MSPFQPYTGESLWNAGAMTSVDVVDETWFAGEPGTVLHYFLRADTPGPDGMPRPLPLRRATAEAARRQRAAKRFALTLKRHLEAGRAPGEPRCHGG